MYISSHNSSIAHQRNAQNLRNNTLRSTDFVAWYSDSTMSREIKEVGAKSAVRNQPVSDS